MGLGTLHGKVAGSRLVTDVRTFEALAGLLGVRRSSLQLKMLFSTNDSGWDNVAAFHQSCDNKGPTLVLIRDSKSNSYGGYTSVSWSSTANGYQTDQNAFLFRLAPGSKRDEKFQVTAVESASAVYCHSTYGPTFGAGHDLQTFSTAGFTMAANPSTYRRSGALISNDVPTRPSEIQLEVLQVLEESDIMSISGLTSPFLADANWSRKVICWIN